MKYTELLTKMKNEYFRVSGENPGEAPQTMGVLEALAAEVYALLCKGQHTLWAAFPQTATGEDLDNHAALRGIERKQKANAKGELTFYLAAALTFDVTIPAGTVVSREGEDFAQYATDEDITIPAGEPSATVPATALTAGEAYNAPAGTLTVLVNPVEYISGVTNENPFTGGTEAEGDASLRERVLSSYSALSNCINEKSVRQLLLTVEGVLDAATAPAEPGITVYLKTASGAVSAELEAKIKDLLGFFTICGAPITVLAAVPKEFSLTVTLTPLPGVDFDALTSKVTARLKDFCAKEKIGRSLTTSELERAVMPIPGIRSADISSPSSVAGSISCGTGEYLTLTSLEVI